MKPFALIAALCVASPLAADIETRFIESAPKDRFVVENTGSCALGAVTLTVDLTASAGKLIFDTTGEGAGVEVFQPFEIVAGGDLVTGTPTASDGDRSVSVDLIGLPAGATFAFTIDVDDTLPKSQLGQIRVAGSEIDGATITLGETTATLGTNARATLDHTCLS